MLDPFWLLLIGIVVVLGGILLLRLQAFLALILGALLVGSLTSPTALQKYAADKKYSAKETRVLTTASVGERVGTEFGRTCAKIGVLIAMASIVGKCLLESGAAERIVRSALKLFGQNGAPTAFLSSGFLLGIPVFFDTVFYLMIPLGKAAGIRNRRKYGLYIMCIVAGATMTHSLVPPTPGPLFVAGELSVNLGLMILGGIVVGLFTTASGYLYALWANRRWAIPLRSTPDVSAADLETLSKKKEKDLPPFWLSILPILLPVVLIAGQTVLQSMIGTGTSEPSAWQKLAVAVMKNLGDSNIALTISAGIALATVAVQRRFDGKRIAQLAEQALTSGGLIILITSAGGAFGGILQQTGIGERIQELAAAYQIGILPLAFLVTAMVRTAQGSATVAMITSVGILGSFAANGQLGFHPLYLALVIGCGSKPIPWMNDSGFWVMCKMTGMTESETLKTCSVMMTLMGVVGLFVVMALARLFPLV